MTALLRRAGLACEPAETEIRVTPPSYRFDLAIEADLVEEVARLSGYDRLPAVSPQASMTMMPSPEGKRTESELRRLLVARDFQEVITYSFVDPALEAALGTGVRPVALQNPIASQMAAMRTSLFPGLVETLRYNLNRRAERVRIFEIGRCFLNEDGQLRQPLRVGGLAFGPTYPEQWGETTHATDFFDLKGEVEAVLSPRAVRFSPTAHRALHPGRAADVSVDGVRVGVIGVLHPALAASLDLIGTPALFELDLDAVLSRNLPSHAEISRFPGVRRDLAIVVGEGVPVQALLDAMREAAVPGVHDIALFDVYRGTGIEPGTKSLAFRILLQDTQKTLADAEIEDGTNRLLDILSERFGARLR
jgi:phenylalanyl-tRNA synthetase beta chain